MRSTLSRLGILERGGRDAQGVESNSSAEASKAGISPWAKLMNDYVLNSVYKSDLNDAPIDEDPKHFRTEEINEEIKTLKKRRDALNNWPESPKK